MDCLLLMLGHFCVRVLIPSFIEKVYPTNAVRLNAFYVLSQMKPCFAALLLFGEL